MHVYSIQRNGKNMHVCRILRNGEKHANMSNIKSNRARVHCCTDAHLSCGSSLKLLRILAWMVCAAKNVTFSSADSIRSIASATCPGTAVRIYQCASVQRYSTAAHQIPGVSEMKEKRERHHVNRSSLASLAGCRWARSGCGSARVRGRAYGT